MQTQTIKRFTYACKYNRSVNFYPQDDPSLFRLDHQQVKYSLKKCEMQRHGLSSSFSLKRGDRASRHGIAISKESRLQCWYTQRSFPPIPRVISRGANIFKSRRASLNSCASTRLGYLFLIAMGTSFCIHLLLPTYSTDIIAWRTFLLILYLVWYTLSRRHSIKKSVAPQRRY